MTVRPAAKIVAAHGAKNEQHEICRLTQSNSIEVPSHYLPARGRADINALVGAPENN
jgi:hypothetical protein